MPGIVRDRQDPQTFAVDWQALHAGRNPWKRAEKVVVDPFLIAKAVKQVMKKCPHQTATGRPLVWNDYAVFLDLSDWERIKKLEATLVRDLGTVVEKELAKSKSEMVGILNVRLLRDEGGSVRPGAGVIKVDFMEGDRIFPPNAGEMTVRISGGLMGAVADLTQRIAESPVTGPDIEEGLLVRWTGGGSTRIRTGSRVVLGRPHTGALSGFVPLTGAGSKINKRQVWIEATVDGALIGRLSRANPVEVKGRLIQAGGQIAVDELPADVSLSNGALVLTVDRLQPPVPRADPVLQGAETS